MSSDGSHSPDFELHWRMPAEDSFMLRVSMMGFNCNDLVLDSP